MGYDPGFTILTIFQVIYISDSIIVLAALETLGPFLILFSSAYLKIIQKRFEGLRKSSRNDLKVADSLDYHEIRELIIFHQRVLE